MTPRLTFSLGGALCVASLFVSAFASSTIVYMHEVENQKQIFAIDENGGLPRAITKGASWHLYPDISADGNTVTYVAGLGETSLNVYTQNLATGAREQWDFGVEGMFLHPDISADGKLLAVSAPIGENGLSQIVIVDLVAERARGAVSTHIDGSSLVSVYKVTEPRTLVSQFAAYFPTFSSDNSFVVFQQTQTREQRSIVKYDLVTNQSVVLSNGFSVAMAPALSFDDGHLAFTAIVNGNWDIYVKNLFTMAVSRITTDEANDYAPTFLNDGSLIFANNAMKKYQLYKISKKDLFAGNPTSMQLTMSVGDAYAPSASGDTGIQQRLATSMNEPARSSFGAVVNANKIYIVGGHKGREHTYPPESFMNNLEAYDLVTHTWETLAPRSVHAHGFGLASHEKYIYAFGGFAFESTTKPQWKSLDVIERYNTQTHTWEIVGKLPRARSSNVVAQVGSKVYLIGGWDSTPKSENDYEGSFERHIDVFDMETLKVTTLQTTLPNPLRRALTGVVVGEEIYLLGGLGQGASHFELLDNVTSYNTKTNKWTEHAKLPFATFAPAAGVMNNNLYIFGGMFKRGETDYGYVNHIFSLNLARESEGWTHTGRYLSEPKGFPQVVEHPTQPSLFVIGGHRYYIDGSDSPVLTMEEFYFSKSKK